MALPMNFQPRTVAVLGLLAMVPVALFTLNIETIAAVSLVNVALIVASLVVAMAPHEPVGGEAH